MIQISAAKTKAVIFDMDGTMIANMHHHKLAWQTFVKKHNIRLSDEEFSKKISGKKNDQIFKILFGDQISAQEIVEYAEEKEQLYRDLYVKDIVEINGLSDFIDRLLARNIRIAIATTAPKKNRDFALRALKLEGKFEVILGDEHVSKGKPDPEIYTETALMMGVSPDECIVFEDSPPGIESGMKAKMTVVALLTSHAAEDINNADHVITDFTEVEVTD
jgi:beta-phosphoglucomutase